MSRIFRNVQMSEHNEKTKSIQIRNLYIQDEINVDQPLSLEIISKERERMVQEVEQDILQKKSALSHEVEDTKQFIENERKAWDEQKLAFQQDAYEEAFAQGLEEGRQKAISDMQQLLKIVNESMNVAHANAAGYLQQQEHVILELAIRTAERIIGTQLEENDELFISIVRRGLKEAREMKAIKIYVSPTYFTLVSNNREELASIFPVDVPFMIFVDEEMNETDCYIETNHGRIVVSIEEQLKELRRKLVDILDGLE